MIEKEKILDAWIMIERLSEGDINPKTEKLEPFKLAGDPDYYGLISSFFDSSVISGKVRNRKKAGVTVYFDIFEFRDVIEFLKNTLREEFTLSDGYDDINYGKKFSFAFQFDSTLKFVPDTMFFVVSAYMRYEKKIPGASGFSDFEQDFRQFAEKEFTEAGDDPVKFNAAFEHILNRFSVEPENCYMKFEKDLEEGGTNLHSFFINDLESAKKIDSDNLDSYLFGSAVDERVDLDSKNDSPKFNPKAFEEILEPENYPLGRFPTNTKFPLSFMQQVAVNLSSGFDLSTIRSVNGPPGTGKTTLLKDIFAHLAVQQAYSVSGMNVKSHTIAARGLDESLPQLGFLPDDIAENNIMVASSNNGAVQNIVNELPLIKEISESFRDDLKEADYFFELSNSRLEKEFSKDEKTGKTSVTINVEPQPEQKFWGLYSLEGGRSDNMQNIYNYINEIYNELAMEYEEQEEIYGEFLSDYKKLEKIRSETENRVRAAQSGSGGSSGDKEAGHVLDMSLDYDDLQQSNPWFAEDYRILQSRLFIKALQVRKQFLFENRKNLLEAYKILTRQEKYADGKSRVLITAAWQWINFAIPVISSTFASFGRMSRYLGTGSIGHLFVDEAGQAVPQAAVGAIYRSRHVMVVGDPAQIKPVVTLNPNVLTLLGMHYGVTERYISESASVQTLVDSAGRFGYFRSKDKDPDSWIGIPLWVHRRCQDPMFTIANKISYDGLMVLANNKRDPGRTGWFDVQGKATDKFVQEQADFLAAKIKKMAEEDPAILDKSEKDRVYVITPFRNVAYKLARTLEKIGFTRRDDHGKPTNIGTIHTFQGKEAPIVFMVLGADSQSKGAAMWAVSEPNMMNVAATRAKEEFYVVADLDLYRNLRSDVAETTIRVINIFKKHHPDRADDDVESVMPAKPASAEKPEAPDKTVAGEVVKDEAVSKPSEAAPGKSDGEKDRKTGTVTTVKPGNGGSSYGYIKGSDGKDYLITEKTYSMTKNADSVIVKGSRVSFTVYEGKEKLYANSIFPAKNK
ncbi:MAG: DNA helicase [Lachnospiraceae bacterium]|nr:DNA helicase [Lachnospiraceae bacterium]